MRALCFAIYRCLTKVWIIDKEKDVLKYFVLSTEQLLPMMLLVGLLLSGIRFVGGENYKRFQWAAVIVGLISAIVMTVFKTTTNKIDTGMWNVRIYAINLAALILFVLVSLILRKQTKVRSILLSVMLSLMAVSMLLYFLPPFFENPHAILFAEQSVLSANFLYSMVGMCLGLILSFVAGLAVYKGNVRLSPKLGFAVIFITVIINLVNELGDAFGVFLAKRIIKTNHTIFTFAVFTSNNKIMFTLAIVLVCLVIPVVLFARSRHVNEPYDNNAEHRKIKAKWRNIKRWSTTAVVCAVFSFVTLTALRVYANQEIEISPIEEAKITDDSVIVTFEQVADGHLHRFGYTTKNGKTVRFIVIKKPNSSAYGIGLDACDICGETGYYEREGQVVCNLCNVVMNINTIGFKGGCNPIVIDYKIHDGNIIVPIAELEKHEDIFK